MFRDWRGTGWKPMLRAVMLLWVMAAFSMAAYYDDTVGDKQEAYRFLDQVEKDVGFEAFEAVSYDHALRLALTLGNLDKLNLTSKAFLGHLQQVAKSQARYYKQHKLTADEAEVYLLPHRIRYEHTKPDWMVTLANHFQPLTTKATTADEAAQAVCGWIADHIKLRDSALSYKLPIRGDLDPLTVFKSKAGSEVDCAIFGVAALRASGVAARIVWAPALRGEIGGKAWLEYRNEAGTWLPWVPTLGKTPDHLSEIRKQIGEKILFVMARPEAPIEITANYVKTIAITIRATQEDVDVSLMVLGKKELLPARDGDEIKNERQVSIGRGPVIIAASFGKRYFALLPIECPPDQEQLTIEADAGTLKLATSNSPLPIR